ncbi:recombinase family protein [Bengtsoniella intestinalis]|uniref:recombinase family protein n=1 Tax=Bengtsoniella intestinalis TaxID=3073143 RepID=UPI00391F3BF3
MNKPIPFAIYSRKSRFTGKGESIGNQVEMCRDYIRLRYSAEEAETALVYEDEGFSGGNLNRPGFKRMMADAKAKKFDAIVIYRLDRISRSISDFSTLIAELADRKIDFICIKEQFDTSSSMGRAMMYISSVFSQLERETIAERIRDNMQELAKTGRWLGGVAPTGYTSESVASITVDGKQRRSCKLHVLPEEAQLVRTVYDVYTETDSLTGTEAELLRRELVTKTGKSFTRFSIKNILQNPVYVMADSAVYTYFKDRNAYLYADEPAFDGTHGIMAYNRTTQVKGKTATLNPMEEWTVTVGGHEGLIPSKMWLSVQASLERNKSKSYRSSRSDGNKALLTGLVYCSCGSRMYAKLTNRITADGQPIYTYVCKLKERSKKACCSVRNANGNILDTAILAQLKSLTEDGSAFRQQLEESRDILFNQNHSQNFIDDLHKKHRELTGQIDSLIDTLTELGDSTAKAPITQRIEKLTEEQTALALRIDELSELSERRDLCSDEFGIFVDLLSVFSNACEGMELEQTRAAVRTLVRYVVWDGETAHLILFGVEPNEVDPAILEAVMSGGHDDDNGDSESLWGEDSK